MKYIHRQDFFDVENQFLSKVGQEAARTYLTKKGKDAYDFNADLILCVILMFTGFIIGLVLGLMLK